MYSPVAFDAAVDETHEQHPLSEVCLCQIKLCTFSIGTCACADTDIAWALQISDLHLSVFNEHWFPRYGDKEGDLQ